ncbi:hypothetical protein DOTSEDRAFT_79559 [Dothistroma septosporum NZE10]|uniref:C2H2-type domain-containing protein n=1 Tax=Dothistroma septosporum (strain NZE10 / CBS 128990) TaxID=675120 RepID=N1PRS4_DOTSN|nr:hypothetical protein DOTSEDRAFT_79559 [Dothistroma septosporum NZE10]
MKPSTPCTLRNLVPFQVLLCVQCGYCVLPRALDRHLKCIHNMGWVERRGHMEEVQGLELVSSEDVTYPHPDSQPVRGLPILQGHACGAPGCHHLCMTRKRMQAHWTSKHAKSTKTSERARSRLVKMQTFFRGSGLRYFRVAHDSKHNVSAQPTSDADSNLPLARDPSGGDEDTDIEWLLIKKFHEHSFLSVRPTKSTRQSWRDQMLQVGASIGFLRYAILSITASHVAYEHPDVRWMYGPQADRYRELATKSLFDPSAPAVKQENFFEYFNLQRLMTLCHISKTQLTQWEDCLSASAEQPVLPEWISVQRSGRALIWQHRGNGRVVEAMHGPGSCLYHDVYLLPETGVSHNPSDVYLRTLETDFASSSDFAVDESCLEALRMLRRVWEVPYRGQLVSFRDMALMWTARIPDTYVDLVKNHDPAALIILAHYCVLWSMCEDSFWYMKYHAARMLLVASRSLHLEMEDWIAWPLYMVSM